MPDLSKPLSPLDTRMAALALGRDWPRLFDGQACDDSAFESLRPVVLPVDQHCASWLFGAGLGHSAGGAWGWGGGQSRHVSVDLPERVPSVSTQRPCDNRKDMFQSRRDIAKHSFVNFVIDERSPR